MRSAIGNLFATTVALVLAFSAATSRPTLLAAEELAEVKAADASPDTPWPKWAWSHWVWEDESTQQSALALVEGYLERDIPVGAIIIDSPWETGYNTFEWDKSLYPDAPSMIEQLHAKGVRVMLWTVPVINVDAEPLYSEAKEKGYFMQRDADSGAAVFKWWKGKGSLIDLWNPEALGWWHHLLDRVLDMQIDGWKCDGAEYNAYLKGINYSPGLGKITTRLDYSKTYTGDFFSYTRQRLGNDRIITTRPIDNYGYGFSGDVVAFSSPAVNWAGWVGDQDASFEGLKAALDNMYCSAQYGFLAFGSDIGGYREDHRLKNSRSKELFIRWAQLGTFCPLMENGGGGEHRPWKFDQQTTDIYRDLVQRHLALWPYLNEQASRAYAEKRSLMRFLDRKTYRYFLGDDLFIAPILKPGTTHRITFPDEGEWVWLDGDHDRYGGGQSSDLEFPIDTFPVYVRAGSKLQTELIP